MVYTQLGGKSFSNGKYQGQQPDVYPAFSRKKAVRNRGNGITTVATLTLGVETIPSPRWVDVTIYCELARDKV